MDNNKIVTNCDRSYEDDQGNVIASQEVEDNLGGHSKRLQGRQWLLSWGQKEEFSQGKNATKRELQT